MAQFRHVHTTFWSDTKVSEEMTPEDKFFYLYLLTNEYTKQIGIYQIAKKQMAFDMGYSIESIKALMQRFHDYHKLIQYNEDTREIAILNWPKYNLKKGGKPIMDCVEKELKEVKDYNFIAALVGAIESQPIKDLFEKELFKRNPVQFPLYSSAFAPNAGANSGANAPNAPQNAPGANLNAPSVNPVVSRNLQNGHESSTISGQKEKEKEKEKKYIVQNTGASSDAQVIPFSKAKEKYNHETDPDFKQFWLIYPVKKDKKVAYLKFKAAQKNHSLEVILEGTLLAIQEYKKTNGENFQYMKHPKTFLNNESFMDYLETSEEAKAPEIVISKAKSIADQMKEIQTSEEEEDEWTSTKYNKMQKSNG
jgi:hypothetical protein